RQAVIYITSQTHHCVNKALHITGLYESVQRTIEINAKFQMDTHALRTQILKDISEGLKPFLVIGSAGTTDTGSVDDMDAIAAISDEFDLWFHVDAAYGGFFMLLEEFKIKFKGIERSDSVVLDPHKSLFIPYGSGAVLVRDRNILLASNVYKAAYMKDAFEMEDINPADTGIELTRHNRALRMWLPLHLHGLAPFKAALQEKLILSNYFHQKISSLGFETGHQPDLTVSIFRFPHDEDNKINQALVDAIHKDGRVFLSSTFIHGKLWIRCAILSHRTHLDEVNLALKMIEENIANLKK
ncbi:MAG: pyridoxal-dependent decarboxylase, partial [Saprospiraceae bacterium]